MTGGWDKYALSCFRASLNETVKKAAAFNGDDCFTYENFTLSKDEERRISIMGGQGGTLKEVKFTVTGSVDKLPRNFFTNDHQTFKTTIVEEMQEALVQNNHFYSAIKITHMNVEAKHRGSMD